MKLPFFLETPFQLKLSLHAVIDKLEERASGSDARAARELLDEVRAVPGLNEDINDLSLLKQHENLVRRLLEIYFPPDLTLNEIKAVSIPYTDIVFNHTRRFLNILEAAGSTFDISIRDFNDHQFYVMNCCLILNEYYGTRLDFSKPLFYDIPAKNGIIKHYRIIYNADFLDIMPTDKVVPLSPSDIDQLMDNYDDLALWKEKFPHESWIIRGFGIMSLFDVTVENAVSIFKEKLLRFDNSFQQSTEMIFRSIYQIPDLEIGFTLFNKEEDKFGTASFGQPVKSFLLSGNDELEGCNVLCAPSYHSVIKEKIFFAVADTEEMLALDQQSMLAARFLSAGIRSFILAPVVKNETLLGVLEVVSPRKKELNSINANKLAVVMPFLTDTLERLVTELQNEVQALIQDKYTTIHSSVYWKFRTEAQRFIHTRQAGRSYDLEEIVFPSVYPLYGQIDIKGSSEIRNSSLQKDLKNQLTVLLALLGDLEENGWRGSFDKQKYQMNGFLEDLQMPLKASTEQVITDYISTEVHPRLREISDPGPAAGITGYFARNKKDTGDLHAYRRKYESTISLINSNMAGLIDERQIEAQAVFPHYYERFKTDGVEHNLYIGASISPRQEFSAAKLHELRLWQLRVLCEMERTHYELKSSLPYALDVTSLILAYHSTIAIRFRMDEKRFDIDGSYNARFEIVKKRIDKAHVKGSDERITESGKITIVYSSETEGEEYIRYIHLLQSENILHSGIEHFEVEDLQGVSGLRVLRVAIVH